MMKKLLFFKSSPSKVGENHEMSTTTRDKKHYVETRWKTVISENLEKKFQKSERFSPVSDRKPSDIPKESLVLRRSRSLSMSSGTGEIGRLGKEDMTELGNRKKLQCAPKCDCSDCRDSKPDKYNVPTIQIPSDNRDFPCSPKSSCGSISIPGQMLDVYVDGEHHEEMKFRICDHRSRNANGTFKGRSHSSSNLFVPSSHDVSRDHLGFKNRRESPRKLAKDVVERLLRLEQFCDSKPRSKHLDGLSYLNIDDVSGTSSPCQDVNGDSDSVLRRKLEETKERAMLLSRELSQDHSFEYYAANTSILTKSRNQLEEERQLVHEISDQLSCRISERGAAREAVSSVKEKMNSTVLKLEKEKDELQSCFHREMDRMADDWAFKLQELQSEERRLRDRVTELAEENVSLQKEVSSFCTKEQEYKDRLSQMEAVLSSVTEKKDQAMSESNDLQKKLSEIQDKLKVVEDIASHMERNYEEKEKENTGLIKSVSRLQGICSQQERTIDGLRQSFNLEAEKQQASNKVGNCTRNLQMEQLRLAEIEQSLRRQLETCSVESDSLRHENIYLLERLKGTGEGGGPSSLKLDQELESSIRCLNNTGLSLVNDTTQMCGKLLEILQRKTRHNDFLETHSLMEYEMKIQGFKQGAEQLERSLGKAAYLLHEKGKPEGCDPDSYGRFQNTNRKTLEDYLKSELKAECLVTILFKEKLYSKERDIELVQAELARASRSIDVMKTEVQDAFDTISCVNHKMKTLELQMITKDGTTNQLEGEVRSLGEELSATKGVLSKVTRERDLMWEEVKQYSEKNMLLNHEINLLKKKMEGLEEDTLLKDGQISILKDSLNNAQAFDAPFGLDHREAFRL